MRGEFRHMRGISAYEGRISSHEERIPAFEGRNTV